ncbi:hypothetical protein L6164_019565 [Bauhinia variegata]|uniref:Uncharacterized protein n=1 Tax=Bauhinia variegata TaxID=167791 RepID=A0ACB9MTI6_BAUVA|nr:hypothetical protein L6164_019565 [Bauhinia variegata]
MPQALNTFCSENKSILRALVTHCNFPQVTWLRTWKISKKQYAAQLHESINKSSLRLLNQFSLRTTSKLFFFWAATIHHNTKKFKDLQFNLKLSCLFSQTNVQA